MSGYLLLQGGGEFMGKMAASDQLALKAAGGKDARIVIIPAAAAPDNNSERASAKGMRWFRHLGATQVTAVPLVDDLSADDPGIVSVIEEADLVYLLGGFPGYLYSALAHSKSWQAVCNVYNDGGVVAGSSAGAMVLCGVFYDPAVGATRSGLNLLPGVCVIPHYQTFGQRWLSQLRDHLNNTTVVGIDEETGMLHRDGDQHWQIFGKGTVTRCGPAGQVSVGPGQTHQSIGKKYIWSQLGDKPIVLISPWHLQQPVVIVQVIIRSNLSEI